MRVSLTAHAVRVKKTLETALVFVGVLVLVGANIYSSQKTMTPLKNMAEGSADLLSRYVLSQGEGVRMGWEVERISEWGIVPNFEKQIKARRERIDKLIDLCRGLLTTHPQSTELKKNITTLNSL